MALSKLREKENELNEREKVLAEKEADFAAKESKLKELEQKLASGGSIPVAYVATTTVQKSTDPSQLKRVKLDVGGKLFSTSVGSLTAHSESSLANYTKIFSFESDGTYLVDRDPVYFEYILNWLRDGEMPILQVGHSWERVVKEAEYFQLSKFPKGPLADPSDFPFPHTTHKQIPSTSDEYLVFQNGVNKSDYYKALRIDFFTAARYTPISIMYGNSYPDVYIGKDKTWHLYLLSGSASIPACLHHGWKMARGDLVTSMQ